MFKSYKPERFSTDLNYPYRNDYPIGLCKNCGYPYGQHENPGSTQNCPKKNEIDFGLIPEFYNDKLNKNIKIL